MKKTPKRKLKLQETTIRVLTEAELRPVVGGTYGYSGIICGTSGCLYD